MKKLILFFFIINSTLLAQLIEENFDYGNSAGELRIVTSNWTRHSGTVNDFMYTTSGLTYTGYLSSGIGGAAAIAASGTDDVNRTFTSQNSSTVYYSFLVNASSVTTTGGDYNIHFGSTGTHFGRVYFKKGSVSGKFVIGTSKSTEAASYTSTEYITGTTYLIVVRYKFNTGSGTDDEVKLWVNPELSGVEPISDLTQTSTTSDVSSLNALSLRQNSSTMIIDGIRVSDSWSQAPLPVQLTSFTRDIIGKKVKLFWQTATEVNNYGFEIQRLAVSNQILTNNQEQNANGWSKIGFINGHGNSNSPKNYSFTDEPFGGKEFKYRLKQIDFDGTFEYSDELAAVFEDVTSFALEQNYPNPFNPVTNISYTIPQRSNVKLRVYNMLAQLEAELVNESQETGHYQVIFNGSNLPSGAYFYKLEAGKFVEVRKLLLIK
jgi:hypothetical protein